MSELSNPSNHHQLLSAARALLATVQQPLGALEQTLQTPEQLLAELTPPLAVVDFAPFAQLTVPVTESRQSAPQPLSRATGSPPVATALGTAASQSPLSPSPALMQPATGSQASTTSEPAKTGTPPVFSLPNPQRPVSVDASVTARRSASLDHSLAQFVGAQATPVTGSAVDNADRNAPLSEHWHDEQAVMPAVIPMVPGERVQPGSLPVARAAAAIEPSLATMPLLAAVVDSLLTAPAARVQPMSTRGASAPGAFPVPVAPTAPPGDGLQWSANLIADRPSSLPANSSNRLSNEPLPMATPPISVPTADPAALLTGWPGVTGENQSINLGLSSGRSQSIDHSPLDAWALAQLINDVLAEEARRHGVDLS